MSLRGTKRRSNLLLFEKGEIASLPPVARNDTCLFLFPQPGIKLYTSKWVGGNDDPAPVSVPDRMREVFMKDGGVKNIDEYIAAFPPKTRTMLRKLRSTIRAAAPDAEETISCRIPAFRQNGTLVYFAAFSDHISFFPTSSGVANFQKELKKIPKGTIQFPVDAPIPFRLVAKIAKFRVGEIRGR
jgi:uncharacterized protein YdhG (YjbR/CyaY superfamily)